MENLPPEQPAPLYAGLGLTDQELLICRLLCAVDEPTLDAAAYAANITTGTGRTHMMKLHKKLGVHTRGGLMRRAIELGIVMYSCARCPKPLL
jgi:DNA-binding CsgD family transcriptional regulator